MSEIKSTLDLVMERTKNLSLSEDEKEKQRERDLRKRCAGLVQQMDDQMIKSSELGKKLDALKQQFGADTTSVFINMVLEGIGIDHDNARRLSLLEDFFKLDVSPLTTTLDAYRLALDDLKSESIKAIKLALSDQYHITGSAVVPNITTDPDWNEKQKTLGNKYQQQLESYKRQLKTN